MSNAQKEAFEEAQKNYNLFKARISEFQQKFEITNEDLEWLLYCDSQKNFWQERVKIWQELLED